MRQSLLSLVPSLVFAFSNSFHPLPGYLFSWTADTNASRLSVQVTLTPPSGTSGWVGFGIAGGAGGMLGGDMFTAYPTGSGTCAIQDRRASSSEKALPTEDTSLGDGFEDWVLDSCSLSGGVFTVAASRLFVTYDANDLNFVSGPMSLLFAWGQPVPSSSASLSMHKGYVPKEVSLWGAPIEVFDKTSLESDHDVVLLSMPSVPIGDQTTYTCKGFSIDKKGGLQTQAIAFEPVIQAINEPYVHHIVLYTCTSAVSATPFSCFSMPAQCSGVLYAWGKGGNAFVMPPVTGMEVGSTGRTYVALQMHYNNPSNSKTLIDNSGVNVYRTNMLRSTSSGMFLMGTIQLALRPGKSVSTVSGKCTPSNLPASGVTVYSSFMHAHQRGRRIWTQVVRNGKIIGTVGNNQNYDFNLQKMFTLSPTVTMLPGDSYITYCSFDTSSDTTTVSWGETTDQEMCFNFLAFYPIGSSQPTTYCGVSDNSPNASSPGPTSCALLPDDPPAAYVVGKWTVADYYFFSGGSVACAQGFSGTAVLGCTGYGAPFTFSGCVRNSKAPTTITPTTNIPTSTPTTGTPTNVPTVIPTTLTPTSIPTTLTPTIPGDTRSPTLLPTSNNPTVSGSTVAPTGPEPDSTRTPTSQAPSEGVFEVAPAASLTPAASFLALVLVLASVW